MATNAPRAKKPASPFPPIKPVAKAAGAGQRIKDQGGPVVTWESFGKDLIGACLLEDKRERSWVAIGDKAWALGVRPSDFDPIKVSGKKDRHSETYMRIVGYVLQSFTKRERTAHDAPLTALGPDERNDRRNAIKKREGKMALVLKYLKRHEEDEAIGTGPVEKKKFSEIIVAVLKEQIDKIKVRKLQKEEDVDFDDARVIELLNEAIAELT